MKTEYYQKVYIKSEEDLPDSEGNYIVHSKIYMDVRDTDFTRHTNDNYPEYDMKLWVTNYDWYLLPVSEPAVVVPDEKIEHPVLTPYGEALHFLANHHDITVEDIQTAIKDYIDSKDESNLKQGYPEEFVEFVGGYCSFSANGWIYYSQQDGRDNQKFDTLPELYQWWIDNIKNK